MPQFKKSFANLYRVLKELGVPRRQPHRRQA